MKLKLLWLLLFVCFLIEGTLYHWLIPARWQESAHVVPLFVLTVVVYASLYIHRHYALFLGLIFGLLQDVIFYGHMLGIHMFSYGLTGYLIGLLASGSRGSRMTFTLTLSMVGASILIYESITYALYSLFQLADVSIIWFLWRQVVPTVLFNLLFALAVYIPLRKYLEQKKSVKESSDV